MYSEKVRKAVAHGPKSLGNQMGRWAVHLDFSVARIAKITGARRQTVYNWMIGGQVTYAYRATVESLLRLLRASTTAEQAWGTACQQFKIQTTARTKAKIKR